MPGFWLLLLHLVVGEINRGQGFSMVFDSRWHKRRVLMTPLQNPTKRLVWGGGLTSFSSCAALCTWVPAASALKQTPVYRNNQTVDPPQKPSNRDGNTKHTRLHGTRSRESEGGAAVCMVSWWGCRRPGKNKATQRKALSDC